jgi:hypothetical protein
MVIRRRPPSQSWATFLRNHADGIAATDLLVVPTVDFRLLYCLVVLGHGRRRLVHYAVTAHPTDEWMARQIGEAFPWEEAPRHSLHGVEPLSNDVFEVDRPTLIDLFHVGGPGCATGRGGSSIHPYFCGGPHETLLGFPGNHLVICDGDAPSSRSAATVQVFS